MSLIMASAKSSSVDVNPPIQLLNIDMHAYFFFIFKLSIVCIWLFYDRLQMWFDQGACYFHFIKFENQIINPIGYS